MSLAGWGAALSTSVVAMAWATAGFTAVTTDGARAARVRRAPVPVPAAVAVEPDGRTTPAIPSGVVAIVDFVSTRCTQLCRAQGTTQQALQRALADMPGGTPIVLRSLSFDPADNPAQLAAWRDAFGARSPTWTIGQLSAAHRDTVLRVFGIVPVREHTGEWRHNAALHLVDRAGQLVRIVPVTQPEVALAVAKRLAAGGAP
jgi:protein SCO1/2